MNATTGSVAVRVSGLSTPLAGLELLARVDAALRMTGRRVAPQDSADLHPEIRFGWEPGTMPLRPLEDQREVVRAALGDPGERSVSWCLVDEASQGACRLADQHTATVEEGTVYLAGVMGRPGALPGLPAIAVGRLLRAARMRFWWATNAQLDPVRVLESVLYGCVPCQVMPPDAAASLRECLPPRLASLVTAVIPGEPIVCPMEEELARIRAQLKAELLASSLERDLQTARV